ncbi:STAS domain-containing protein [Candidatus Fermentibacteria bacterium]|nr:STAS domain-containing protein [Candidatus Fermentibacteria bacterium]
MKITRRDVGNVVVLTLKGKLIGGPEAIEFRETVKNLIAEDKTKVLVDLGGVSWIDSTGLGTLISGYTSLKKSNGDLKLCHLTKKIHSLLVITQLITVLEDYDDEEQAIATLQS